MEFLFFKKIGSLLDQFFARRRKKRVWAFVVDSEGAQYKIGPYSSKYRVIHSVEKLIAELVAEGRLGKEQERYYRQGIRLDRD